jgi:hypothetical protein
MPAQRTHFTVALGLAAMLLLPAAASADSVRFRFVPANADGGVTQVAAGPDGAIGELRNGFRGTAKPYAGNFQPNRMVTFLHPYTNRNVLVPMKLPDGTPRIEHIAERIRFNYGTYYVEARFLPDGGVDVVYNSGLLRALP